MTTKIPEELINSGSATDGYVLTADGSGNAAWEEAGGGGGLVLLSSGTANNSAYIDFNSVITSEYDDYILRCNMVRSQNDGDDLLLQASTDNGSSYISTGAYDQHSMYGLVSSTTNTGDATGRAGIGALLSLGNAAAEYGNAIIRLSNLSDTTYSKMAFIEWGCYYTNGFPQGGTTFGVIYETSAINALRLNMSTGNIVIGTFRLYGVSKS